MQTSIEVFKQYPRDKFIPLVPVQTITQISPLHKVSINVVQVSTDERDKDAYKEKNGELALTKKGLTKLMTAANIEIVKSNSVMPSSCQRCLEMARATGKPCACGECSCKNDIAWQVTIAVPDISGGMRRVTATREFICADERKKSASEKQYDQAFVFRSAYAEAKALNRALRTALSIKSTYRADELSKPFAVPVISPNYEDPELKSAMIKRFAAGENLIFGQSTMLEAPAQHLALASGDEIVIPPDEDEPDRQDAIAAEVEPATFEDIPVSAMIECHDCGGILEEFADEKSGIWTVERLAEYARKHFKVPLCRKCMTARLAEQKKGAA